jgi:shikimate dehydrogenase
MTRICGVIGRTLSHSISAAFQQAAFDALDMDVRYQAWELPPEALGQHLNRLRRPEALGCNVTIPYKLAVLPYLARRDALVDRVGAANTLGTEGGRLAGSHSDFLRALRGDGAFDPAGAGAVLLGAGGAARAVAVALLSAGVERLWLSNRHRLRADELAAVLASRRVAVLDWHSPECLAVVADVSLVVNATPAGMLGSNVDVTPLPEPRLTPGALVVDLVANPLETRLVREARAAGARVLGGLPMLVYQGAESFQHWTGRPAPVEVMRHAAAAAMAGRGYGAAE